MIDNNSLVQVFATVLVGVLIFLTLEKRIEKKDVVRNAFRRIDEINRASYALRDERRKEHDRIVEELLDPSYKEDAMKQRSLKRDLDMTRNQKDIDDLRLKNYQEELDSIPIKTAEYLMTEAKYTDLKTKEGIITLGMIVLLSVSVIWMVMTSALNMFPPMKDILQQSYDSLISSLMFSVGIILLILRVYLHRVDTVRK